MSLHGIRNNESIYQPILGNFSMGLIIIEIILVTLIISTYAMIVKKFWALREYLVYKVVNKKMREE